MPNTIPSTHICNRGLECTDPTCVSGQANLNSKPSIDRAILSPRKVGEIMVQNLANREGVSIVRDDDSITITYTMHLEPHARATKYQSSITYSNKNGISTKADLI